jgi:hypothetical protein
MMKKRRLPQQHKKRTSKGTFPYRITECLIDNEQKKSGRALHHTVTLTKKGNRAAFREKDTAGIRTVNYRWLVMSGS